MDGNKNKSISSVSHRVECDSFESPHNGEKMSRGNCGVYSIGLTVNMTTKIMGQKTETICYKEAPSVQMEKESVLSNSPRKSIKKKKVSFPACSQRIFGRIESISFCIF